jgi:hypothetical protein
MGGHHASPPKQNRLNIALHSSLIIFISSLHDYYKHGKVGFASIVYKGNESGLTSLKPTCIGIFVSRSTIQNQSIETTTLLVYKIGSKSMTYATGAARVRHW